MVTRRTPDFLVWSMTHQKRYINQSPHALTHLFTLIVFTPFRSLPHPYNPSPLHLIVFRCSKTRSKMPTAVSVSQVQVSNNSKAQAVAKAQALALHGYKNQSTFTADAVLFDMVR